MTDKGKANEVAAKLNDQTVYIYGDSQSRGHIEYVRQEAKLSHIDQYFRYLEQLRKIGHEQFNTVEYQEVEEKMDNLVSISHRIRSCLYQADEIEIQEWFEEREITAGCDETAIGVALTKKKARELFLNAYEDSNDWGDEEDGIEN